MSPMPVLSIAAKKGLRRLERWTTEHALLAAEAGLAGLGAVRPSALLLLGHMRSGSTLLLHLLEATAPVPLRTQVSARFRG